MGTRRESRAVNSENLRPRRARNSRARSGAKVFWFALFAVFVALAVIVGVTQVSRIQNYFSQFGVEDYPGPGTTAVQIVIHPGDTGTDVANALVAADVVKDFKLIFKEIVAQNPTFYPGTYELKKKMSSAQALLLLTSGNSRVINKVTVKEGLRIQNVLKELSVGLQIPLADLKTAAKDFKALGIPDSEVSAEGWLFPATYEFEPGTQAKTVLTRMVDRTIQELSDQAVPQTKWHSVLTLASIIQKEARISKDFFKVSRVFTNRIKIGMHLQSDATVSYGSGGKTVTTTDAERADPNGFNTYVHPGLPIGPISAPGALAIDAALHPAKGNWLFFCTVNLQTGETVFSETVAEHEIAVAQFQSWLRANPGWND